MDERPPKRGTAAVTHGHRMQNEVPGDAEVSTTERRVLILGGSAFIGRTTTNLLVSKGYKVCLANRGHIYWGLDLGSKVGIEHVQVDREETTKFAERIRDVTTNNEPWFAVVDFSAYKPYHLLASLRGLGGLFGQYIYISSDSVYEVSDSAQWRNDTHVNENFDRRPMDACRRRVLKRKDSYAHYKLACEELLRSYSRSSGKTIIALRLADVIGPYDDTNRLWTYWWWCTHVDSCPVFVEPDGMKQPLNFTYSQDVADAIYRILILQRSQFRNGEDERDLSHLEDLAPLPVRHVRGCGATDEINNKDLSRKHTCSTQEPNQLHKVANSDTMGFRAYNLACDAVTLTELLSLVHAYCPSRHRLRVLPRESDGGLRFPTPLPSVCRDKPLTMRAIKEDFGFYPSRLEEAVAATCAWFEDARTVFRGKAVAAAKLLPKPARTAAMKSLGITRNQVGDDISTGSHTRENGRIIGNEIEAGDESDFVGVSSTSSSYSSSCSSSISTPTYSSDIGDVSHCEVAIDCMSDQNRTN